LTSLRSRAPIVTVLFAISLASFLTGSSPSVAAQQSGSSASPKPEVSDLVFRSTVNRVIVDVVVTDSAGKPVRGLRQRDFEVAEDSVPQRILSFDVHDFEGAAAFVPPNLPPLPPNTFLNLPAAPEKGPLYVLLLDLVNMEMPNQMWARQELVKFVKDKPEGTRFAVFVVSDGLHLVQGFSSDRERIFAAVDPSHPKHHEPKVFLYARNYGQHNRGMAVSVFQDIARYLDGLPGRKNIMWLADSFPLSLYHNEGDSYDFSDDVKEIIDLLAREQAAVYTFNASGVGGGASITEDPLGFIDVNNLTGATGGKAYFENDLKVELADATEDGANYYTLSYAPSNTNYNGKERKIKVHLDKDGYQLSYRRSYYSEDPYVPVHRKVSSKDEPAPPAPRKPGDSLIANMEFGAPVAHELIFRAHVQTEGKPAMGTPAQMANLSEQPAYFQVRRKSRPATPLKPILLQTYAVDYTVLLPPRPEGAKPLALEFATAAFDEDGTMLNGVVENGSRISSGPVLSRVQGTGPAGQGAGQPSAESFYRAQQHIDVPLAATSIRVAVRDMSTDRIGALEVNLPPKPESQARAATPPQSAPQSADSAAERD
jgi:VWFA-related protein